MLTRYAPQGLRLIEVDKNDLLFLQDVVDLVSERPERFIVFCDDLSFEEGEAGYDSDEDYETNLWDRLCPYFMWCVFRGRCSLARMSA